MDPRGPDAGVADDSTCFRISRTASRMCLA